MVYGSSVVHKNQNATPEKPLPQEVAFRYYIRFTPTSILHQFRLMFGDQLFLDLVRYSAVF